MTLEVWTARIGSIVGDDVLDVTRKSGGERGDPFAPSKELLDAALRARSRAKRIFAKEIGRRPYEELVEEARAIEHEAWERYEPAFVEEMRASYRRKRRAWEELLDLPRVCLVCYCRKPERCHRTVLARRILPALGAVFVGELEPVRGRRRSAIVEPPSPQLAIVA